MGKEIVRAKRARHCEVRRKGGGGAGRACGCAREGKSVYKPTTPFIIFEQILGKFTKKFLPRIFVANFEFTKNFLGCQIRKKRYALPLRLREAVLELYSVLLAYHVGARI